MKSLGVVNFPGKLVDLALNNLLIKILKWYCYDWYSDLSADNVTHLNYLMFPKEEKLLEILIYVFVFLFVFRKLWWKWDGSFQRYGSQGRDLHCTLLQDLQQCWRAELWQAAAKASEPPAQGKSGRLLLWRHDCERPLDGHEAPGTRWRVFAARQVSNTMEL